MNSSNLEQNNGDKDSLESSAQYEVHYRPAPTWTRALQWAIVGCIGFGFIYAAVARIDEVVIARGELKGIGAERPIKAHLSGVVSRIPVSEGELVSPGQVLIQFDSEVSNERLRSLERQKKFESKRLAKEIQAFEARVDSLEAQLKSLQVSLKVEAAIVERMTSLVSQAPLLRCNIYSKGIDSGAAIRDCTNRSHPAGSTSRSDQKRAADTTRTS